MTGNQPGRTRVWSLRGRVLTLVGLSALPAVLGAVVGTVALTAVNAKVAEVDARSVSTLVALADLRDMEGDMRVQVHAFVDAAPGERAAMRQDIRTTDDALDADLTAFLRGHGSTTDAEAVKAAAFRTALGSWRTVRDTQVLTVAEAGHRDAATKAVAGPLADADDRMAGPLDDVFTLEKAGADTRVADAQHTNDVARIWLALIIAGGVLVTAGVAWLLIHRPVALLGRITELVAGGDLGRRVAQDDGSDVGRLGAAIDTLLDTIAGQQAEIAREQAARERQLAANFARQQLAEREVRTRAQSVIDETSRSVLAELEGVVEQASEVRAASAEIDARVADTDTMTRAVVSRAASTEAIVSAVTESLRRVGGIAQLIAGVAEQTNLLALNATIEAARAGDAGKGFSVVANEVKELAAETGRSTSEISVTVNTLEADASAMAATIEEMARGVSGMGDATGLVTQVAARQRESVESLDARVQEAMARIRGMSRLTEKLERRETERVVVHAPGTMHLAGGTSSQCEVVDLSETGVRVCLEVGPVPQPGEVVTIDLPLSGRNESFRVRIVRVTDATSPYEVGGTFDDLSADVAHRLRRYLASVRTAVTN